MPGKKPASAAPSRKRDRVEAARPDRRTSSPSTRGPRRWRCAQSRSARRLAPARSCSAPRTGSSRGRRCRRRRRISRADRPRRRVHLQRGEADIDAIEVGDEIQQSPETESVGGAPARSRDVADWSSCASHLRSAPRCSQPSSNSFNRPPVRGCAATGIRVQRDAEARAARAAAKQPSAALPRAAPRPPARGPRHRRNR